MFRKKRKTKQWKKTLCLNKCSIKYLFTIIRLYIKYNFHRWKPVDPPPAAPEVCQIIHRDSIDVYNMLWQVYHAFTMHDTIINLSFLTQLTERDCGGGAAGFERSPRKRKVGRSNPSRNKPKSLKQVVTAPLLNARQ